MDFTNNRGSHRPDLKVQAEPTKPFGLKVCSSPSGLCRLSPALKQPGALDDPREYLNIQQRAFRRLAAPAFLRRRHEY
ncbi:MAG: hypothetical protein IT323_08235 [Anaerolineae bacterium]|nr:hypothetical protein [Anaerolineae bacterium]